MSKCSLYAFLFHLYISKDRYTYIYYSPKGRWVCDQSSVMYLLFFQVQNQHIRVSGCVTNPVLYVPAILSYQKYTISTTFQVQNQQKETHHLRSTIYLK